jgi:hypothetical protein
MWCCLSALRRSTLRRPGVDRTIQIAAAAELAGVD